MQTREQMNCAHRLPRGEAIAQLNDRLRRNGLGGRIVVTRGVRSLPNYETGALLKALAAFDHFDVANDPHGERDFGDLDAFEQTLLWKVDYYDRELTYASPDPADPSVTSRVLTIMLESEY